MKKSIWLVLLLILGCIFTLSACDEFDQLPSSNNTINGTLSDTTQETENPSGDIHVHSFGEWHIVKDATCTTQGERKRSCSCGENEIEKFSLPEYSATELYNKSVKYVGEIVTYDKNGDGYALGTGFVISSDGKVVTNYHVIEGAYSADITIDNTTYKISSALAYDANIDLAVLKINATGLSTATICKEPVSVGESVYAIGSSRGMTNTYSKGIITYADRIVDGVSYVQHDASITNGNSGGPLINAYGEVIGINTWGISDSQNLNFAVFTDELDNLIYGTPITLSELFQEQLTPYETLLDWLITNQNRQGSSMVCYDYWQGTTMYTLGYDPKNDYMCVMINDGSFMLLLDLDCDPSEYYYIWDWELETPADYYKVTGTINAYTYTTDTVLRNYNYTSGIYLEESKVVSMAQTSISLAVAYLENLLLTHSEIGLEIGDFGFISFE